MKGFVLKNALSPFSPPFPLECKFQNKTGTEPFIPQYCLPVYIVTIGDYSFSWVMQSMAGWVRCSTGVIQGHLLCGYFPITLNVTHPPIILCLCACSRPFLHDIWGQSMPVGGDLFDYEWERV